MKIDLVAVGTRSPKWISAGFDEYNKRIQGGYRINLHEIQVGKRTKNRSMSQLIETEGQKMLGLVDQRTKVIALDVKGEQWTTPQMAKEMHDWELDAQNVALLVGGPDGLSPACIDRANKSWSLSPLTFPHFLVRVLIAEQIYRGWSLLNNHPYHK